jgi:hypothetical protein
MNQRAELAAKQEAVVSVERGHYTKRQKPYASR